MPELLAATAAAPDYAAVQPVNPDAALAAGSLDR
jgi:hypothetical protein